MKPTQQEIIELAREAGIVFDERAMPYYERLVHLALERFGAGGGEPDAYMAYNTKTGERCPFLADDPDLQHAKSFAHVKTQALYLHLSPTDLRAEYLRGLEDAAKVCDERAQGLLSIIDLPVVSSPIIQKDRAAQWKDAATKIRELKGKQ